MAQYEFTNQYQRNQSDFYIDPPWCSERLFEKVKFRGIIHDPAVGSGNIINSAIKHKYLTTCADIEDRGYEHLAFVQEDFLLSERRRDNVVTNPPYNRVEEFTYHALKRVRYKVAILARLAFLEGQNRYKHLFSQTPPTQVFVFSTRPSMPPPGVPVGGGKTAYCWLIWDKSCIGLSTTLDWII